MICCTLLYVHSSIAITLDVFLAERLSPYLNTSVIFALRQSVGNVPVLRDC